MDLFDAISQNIVDAWLCSDENAKSGDVYTGVIAQLNIKMALSVIATGADDPYDWRFSRIKDFGFKSRQLDVIRREFPDAALRDLNKEFIDGAIIDSYLRVLELKRPVRDVVRTTLLGIEVGYERIILPQKCEGKPQWCISLVEGRFFIDPLRKAKTDTTDDNIIQLLIEGQTTKEIAGLLKLSPRTVEHRIDKLKDRFEARNMVHLVAKLVAAQVGHKVSV